MSQISGLFFIIQGSYEGLTKVLPEERKITLQIIFPEALEKIKLINEFTLPIILFQKIIFIAPYVISKSIHLLMPVSYETFRLLRFPYSTFISF